jgi:superfamily II RNA helicase
MSNVNVCTGSFPYDEQYSNYFNDYSPIILSNFQKWALKAIVDGDNVLVTAHTGSGKTLPAEFAINFFTKKCKKVIYASPIKALSNQKLYDFRRKFPHISFGILTGDCKDNPDADVLIMTTEILRNTLFNKKIQGQAQAEQVQAQAQAQAQGQATQEQAEQAQAQAQAQAPPALSFQMDFENDLAAVVFDEVHYINDIERGSVWEQSILLLPPQVQLIMLSATIDKPENFAGWIGKEKEKQAIALGIPTKQIYLAPTYERVVPLTHYMWLSMPSKTFKSAKHKPIENKLPDLHNKPIVIADSTGTYNEKNYYRVNEVLDFMNKNDIYTKRQHVMDELLRYLKTNNMLPAICFIFSRKQVEQVANDISFNLFDADSSYPALVERECRHILSTKLPNYEEYTNLPEYKEIILLLQKGIAIHHAGIMPVLREMVELLFEKGYVRLLCATETFAVGLNMPTKTVIFTGLTKFNGSTMRLLYPHEYTQMAGRAGRRGLDTIGHVIHCSNIFEMPLNSEYKNMLTGAPQTLTSKFKISFQLILNILATTNSKDATLVENFMEQSLLSSDIKKELLYYANKQSELETQLSVKKDILTTCKTPEERMADYTNKLAQLTMSNNNMKKKLRSEITGIEAEYKTLSADLKKFHAYKDALSTIEQNKTDQLLTSGYICSQIKSIETILRENTFITAEDYSLTDKGRVASQLQEVHPLMFADIYMATCGFASFTATDLAVLFSCFSNVSIKDCEKAIEPPLKTANAELNSLAKLMETTLDRYYAIETRERVETGSCYDIQYDMMTAVLDWCRAGSEDDCRAVIEATKNEKNIFLGEFVKAMLKINNIAKEFEKVCELLNNMGLLEKMREIPRLTLKYVVTSQSLYI